MLALKRIVILVARQRSAEGHEIKMTAGLASDSVVAGVNETPMPSKERGDC